MNDKCNGCKLSTWCAEFNGEKADEYEFYAFDCKKAKKATDKDANKFQFEIM